MQQPRVSFRLIGHFAAACDSSFAKPIRISTKKSAALIAILLLARDMRMRREHLASLLWGSSGEAQARQSLRQALFSLRKDLQGFDLVLSDNSHVWLDPTSVWVDVLELQRLALSTDPDTIASAYALLRGEPLGELDLGEEEFGDWLQVQRSAVTDVCTHVIVRHSSLASDAGKGEIAVAAVDRLLDIDPLREDWHQVALKVYARHLGPQKALALARKLKETIARELGEPLDPATLKLIEEIRSTPWAPIAMAPPVKHTVLGLGGELSGDLATIAPLKAHLRERPKRVAALAATALMVVSVFLAGARWSTRQEANVHPSSLLHQMALSRLESGTVVLAVLPFTSVGDVSDRQSIFAEMVTEELTSVLSSQPALRVVSRETANTYRGQRIDAQAVARELGIRYLLEGSVALRGDVLRINVGLVDGRSGLRVWAQRLERSSSALPDIHLEMVNSLGWLLQSQLNTIESTRATIDPTVHALIRGAQLRIQSAGERGAASLHEAKVQLDAALAREPHNTHARIALGSYHVNLAVQLLAEDQNYHLQQAETLAKVALETSPRNPGPFLILGLVEWSRGHSRAAAKHFEQAIELNPSDARAHAQYGRSLMRVDLTKGYEHVRYAMRLSPRDPHLSYWLGFAAAIELERKDLGSARRSIDRALELNPQQPRNLLVSASVASLEGRMETAAETIAALQRSLPHMREEVIRKRFGGAEGSEYRRGLDLALATAEKYRAPSISIR